MKEVFIVEAVRTAVGNLNGTISGLPAHKLGEIVIREILTRSQITDLKDFDEVIMGQVLTGGQGQNPARQASINAGLPIEVPAWNVNQVCGSGLKSVALAFQAISSGQASMVIAGGQESMSKCPHSLHLRNGVKFGDAKMIDMMQFDGLTDAFKYYSMGITAENIAKKLNITRQEQDEFSCDSQNKAQIAQKTGKFKDEIVPITIESRKGDIIFDQDEFIRPGTTIETLGRLKPAFDKEGTVTAGNASGINDGAAAVMIADEIMIKKYNLKPLAKIVSWAQAGVAPDMMGLGPIPAVRKALLKANWNIKDLDLIESNEAFAAQAIAVTKELGWDINKVNVNGGAIAIGHPIGASGARILVTLLHEMKKRQAKKGLATLCIGGGMGISLCVEAI